MAKGDGGSAPAPAPQMGMMHPLMGGFNPFGGQQPRFAMPQRPNMTNNQIRQPANGMMMRPPMAGMMRPQVTPIGPSPQTIPGMTGNTGIAGGLRSPRFGQY